MKKILLVLIAFTCFVCNSTLAQYNHLARHCKGNTCDLLYVEHKGSSSGIMTFSIKNTSEDKTLNIKVFAKKTNGEWISLGGALIAPGRTNSDFLGGDLTSETIIYYGEKGGNEEFPSASWINKSENHGY